MKRDQFKQTAWSLDELLPVIRGTEFDRMLVELEDLVAEMETWRERLSDDIIVDDFAKLMRLYESITKFHHRMAGYGQLWFAADTQSQEALAFKGRMDELFTEVQNRLLFFTLWWKGLDCDTAVPLLETSGDWRYYLETLRRFKPHTLSEPEEKIINLKNVNGVEALTTLYDMITNKYSYRLTVDGESKEMTRSELSAYYNHPSPEIRQAAYRELNRVYAEDGALLGQIYVHCARDWRNENMRLRHFESPISVRNLGNDIQDSVVNTLLDVCQQNAAVFQDYFQLKAGWLGMEKLRRYDIYAPLQLAHEDYAYGQAVEMALDSLHSFAPILAEHARSVFVAGHIDSEIRPGKEGGAFCAGMLPGVAPWVKVNYTGKARDVATLAHELGHAVHALMAGEHSILTFHSSLPLAEMASVFAEMLLTERLVEKESDPAVQRNILAAALDDAYATVLRQAFFVLFEREAHAMISQGRTTDDLRGAYLQNLAQQFGDAVQVDESFHLEWVSIPHIYRTPFYCYAYSFGQLLVLALYQRYKEDGEAFIPRYLKMLSYGGSASPQHILAEAGVDMTSADFWKGGFDVIRGMVERLTTLQ